MSNTELTIEMARKMALSTAGQVLKEDLTPTDNDMVATLLLENVDRSLGQLVSWCAEKQSEDSCRMSLSIIASYTTQLTHILEEIHNKPIAPIEPGEEEDQLLNQMEEWVDEQVAAETEAWNQIMPIDAGNVDDDEEDEEDDDDHSNPLLATPKKNAKGRSSSFDSPPTKSASPKALDMDLIYGESKKQFSNNLSEKLTSPDRIKKPSSASDLSMRLINADNRREALRASRVSKSHATSIRILEARRTHETKLAKDEVDLSEKLRLAKVRQREHIQSIRTKALSENSKVDEIAFINEMNWQAQAAGVLERQSRIDSKIEASRQRRHDLLLTISEVKKKKHEERSRQFISKRHVNEQSRLVRWEELQNRMKNVEARRNVRLTLQSHIITKKKKTKTKSNNTVSSSEEGDSKKSQKRTALVTVSESSLSSDDDDDVDDDEEEEEEEEEFHQNNRSWTKKNQLSACRTSNTGRAMNSQFDVSTSGSSKPLSTAKSSSSSVSKLLMKKKKKMMTTKPKIGRQYPGQLLVKTLRNEEDCAASSLEPSEFELSACRAAIASMEALSHFEANCTLSSPRKTTPHHKLDAKFTKLNKILLDLRECSSRSTEATSWFKVVCSLRDLIVMIGLGEILSSYHEVSPRYEKNIKQKLKKLSNQVASSTLIIHRSHDLRIIDSSDMFVKRQPEDPASISKRREIIIKMVELNGVELILSLLCLTFGVSKSVMMSNLEPALIVHDDDDDLNAVDDDFEIHKPESSSNRINLSVIFEPCIEFLFLFVQQASGREAVFYSNALSLVPIQVLDFLLWHWFFLSDAQLSAADNTLNQHLLPLSLSIVTLLVRHASVERRRLNPDDPLYIVIEHWMGFLISSKIIVHIIQLSTASLSSDHNLATRITNLFEAVMSLVVESVPSRSNQIIVNSSADLTESSCSFSYAASLIQVIASCKAVEGIMLLLATFVIDFDHEHSDAFVTSNVIPDSNIFSISTVGFRALNCLALIDLNSFQTSFSSQSHEQYQHFLLSHVIHVTEVVLKYANFCQRHESGPNQSLVDVEIEQCLCQLLIFIGYIVLDNKENQESMHWGPPPTFLTRICSSIPFSYFSQNHRRLMLFPTLLALCSGQDDINRQLITQDVSKDLLKSLVMNIMSRSEAVNGNKEECVRVSERFPRENWQRVLDVL